MSLWIVAYENRNWDRTYTLHATEEDARARAWKIIEGRADADEEDEFEEFKAADDLWGAWDRFNGGAGWLDVERIKAPPPAPAAAGGGDA